MANNTPKICLLDIETSPLISYLWGTYQQNSLKILEPSKIISVAWKYLGEDAVYCKSIQDYKGYKKGQIEDKALIQEVWKVLDEADIVIAHHGDAFDIKKLNSRFVYHGMSAPSHYQTIDTKKSASRFFKFDSNSLNNLGEYLGEGKKVENGGFGLWLRCIAGDKQAWEDMKTYNVQDVVLLEKIYLRLRPFIANHPDLTLVSPTEKGSVKCSSCLSTDVSKRGFSHTKTGRKQRFQCNSCASWSTGSLKRNSSEEAVSEA